MKIQLQFSQCSLLLLASLHPWKRTEGFLAVQAPQRPQSSFAFDKHSTSTGTDLSYSKYNSDERFDHLAQKELARRLQIVRQQVLEEEWNRPPYPGCSPEQLVRTILTALWESDDPLPDSGFLLLLRTATKQWRAQILKSIGAPTSQDVDWQLVSSALGAAMARPNNQFGLLVPGDANDHEDETNNDDDHHHHHSRHQPLQSELPYILEFPFEPLDYDDGTAWLECQMRDKRTNQLLVITGWTLQRRDDGAWLVDAVTWHDLRDEFRPGVGQTEWMRVCR